MALGKLAAIHLQCNLINVAQTSLTHHIGMNNKRALAWCYLSLIILYPTWEFQILRKLFCLFTTLQYGDSWQAGKGRQNSTHFRLMTFTSFLNLYGLVVWLKSGCLTPPAAVVFFGWASQQRWYPIESLQEEEFEYAWCSSPNKAQLGSLKKWIIKAEMNYAFNWPGLVWYKPISCHCSCNVWLPLR